jgi:hypothetical protein
MSKVPVLFIIFNRPEIALESFQAIKQYQPERLYIAADGPRKEKIDDAIKCKNTRNVIEQNIDWPCTVEKLYRDENRGCGRGPSEAITWLFDHEEYGVVIEDDCIVVPEYFRFCEELLEKYIDDDRVVQINCWNPRSKMNESSKYYFTGYPEITAWATWRRAWKHFDIELKDWNIIKKQVFKRFSLMEAIIHYYLWNKQYKIIKTSQKLDAWDYQWSIYVFLNNKLCIEPEVNLVRNIGVGTDSTHCEEDDNPLFLIGFGTLKFPLISPKEVSCDKTHEKFRSKIYVRHYVKLLYKHLGGVL